jgi:hypothetical protein
VAKTQGNDEIVMVSQEMYIQTGTLQGIGVRVFAAVIRSCPKWLSAFW